MANDFYMKGKEALKSGEIDWVADCIRVAVVDSSYTPNLIQHQFLADIPESAVLATSELTGRHIAAGSADGDTVYLQSVKGEAVRAYVIYSDTGIRESSRLIVCVDRVHGSLEPGVRDMRIEWDRGANKVFRMPV